jgi:type II secretory pathway pseudopilin PulG
MPRGRKLRSLMGFTLVEALASVVLISVGVVATLTTLSAFSRSQLHANQSEEMLRLAIKKYDEIVATGALPSGEASGDFSDVNKPDLTWRAERNPTGTGNLDLIQVDVSRKGDTRGQRTEIQGLLCRPAPDKPSSGSPGSNNPGPNNPGPNNQGSNNQGSNSRGPSGPGSGNP